MKLNADSRDTILVDTIRPLFSSDSGTLTSGSKGYTCGTQATAQVIGFESGTGGFGSYSPVTLTGGKTVSVIVDIHKTNINQCLGGTHAQFSAAGFTANPGSTWLSSVECNGVTNSGSAAGFTYASGVATWTWSTLFNLPNATNVSCTIIHN